MIIFFVYDADDPNMKEYELNFSENEDGTFLLSFSGYEFQCSMKKHISTEHNTSNISETKAKIADGNPKAHVKGRNTVGNIPHPAYNVQENGVVVVNIWVDNYGNVVKAVPGGNGTTVLDKTLYAAARKAAMETHFNMNADAPAMQEGTITYYF